MYPQGPHKVFEVGDKDRGKEWKNASILYLFDSNYIPKLASGDYSVPGNIPALSIKVDPFLTTRRIYPFWSGNGNSDGFTRKATIDFFYKDEIKLSLPFNYFTSTGASDTIPAGTVCDDMTVGPVPFATPGITPKIAASLVMRIPYSVTSGASESNVDPIWLTYWPLFGNGGSGRVSQLINGFKINIVCDSIQITPKYVIASQNLLDGTYYASSCYLACLSE